MRGTALEWNVLIEGMFLRKGESLHAEACQSHKTEASDGRQRDYQVVKQCAGSFFIFLLRFPAFGSYIYITSVHKFFILCLYFAEFSIIISWIFTMFRVKLIFFYYILKLF